MPPLETQRHCIPDDLAGARLDRVLAVLVPGHSRTRLQALVRDGHVQVDGEAVLRPNTPVTAGAWIDVEFQAAPAPRVADPTVKLPVLFADEHLIVIDKPAGLIAHRTERDLGGTIADLAQAEFGDLPAVQGADRPGIVHRLDRFTTGVMVLGRTLEALENLKAQFQARTVQKTYRATSHGNPRFDSDWIESSIAPLRGHHDRYRALSEPDEAVDAARADEFLEEQPVGRTASTYYEVIERFRGFVSLVCTPKTGRTHQIRVHLYSAGLPIVGDRQYGPRGGVRVPLPREAPAPSRQALHAQRLEFAHPATGERVHFEAPLPADMVELEAWLREHMAPGG